MLSIYKKLSLIFLGDLVEKYIGSFKPLEPHIKNANMKVLLKTWVSMLFLTTFITFIISFISIYALLTFLIEVEIYIYVFSVVFFPVFVASIVFIIFYLYPVQRENSRKKSIENNLPFAITHMAAIASSGIPTEFMFELLTGFKEYGEITEDSRLIMRNIKTFGMSSVDSLKDIAERTPSKDFREVLLGIVSTVESGGNIVEYLREMAERALFSYSIKREKYLKTLSTYADIYTALLVAAPLMMLSLLATMSIIGGSVMGLTIGELMLLITWVVLPVLNVGFLVFIHTTYPGV
ncbi:MAG: type II secretion system F family protein [Candidatus Aenigmatarchaeota archaeon]|nr:MAG: type II secretion system F family protein [Candidatus Aenigmarchaeota archaeon]